MSKTLRYLDHLLHSKTRHGVHSPFVYDFVTQVLPHKGSATGRRIEADRREAKRDTSRVEIVDYGAGYGGIALPVIQKSIAQVVRSSARGRWEGELLRRIVRYYDRKSALELGTNLGFSTRYISDGLSADAELISIEGSEQLSKYAARALGETPHRLRLLVGEFTQVLRDQIDWGAVQPDFVLLDGNHRREPTLDYVNFLLPKMAQGGILIVDDINWSAEMAQAWQEVIELERVTVSLDLFHMGVCFLDRPQAKEHFRLRVRPF
ncbi:MAG: class I SAM-dependent methyltransferase [Bacteroidia bacterium]